MKHTWGMRLCVVSAVAACSLALMSCEKATDPDGEHGAKPKAQGSSSPSATAIEPDGEITDHGDGERRLLELEVADGDRFATTTIIRMRQVVGRARTRPLRFIARLTSEVVAVSDGGVTVRSTIDEVTVAPGRTPPRISDWYATRVEAYEDRTLIIDYAPSGALVEITPSFGDAGWSVIDQVVEQFVGGGPANHPVFPAEPVGEGAVWRAPVTVEGARDLPAELVVTYTLVQLDGDNYRIRTRMLGGFTTGDSETDDLITVGLFGPGSFSGTTRSLFPSAARITLNREEDGLIDGQVKQYGASFDTATVTKAD